MSSFTTILTKAITILLIAVAAEIVVMLVARVISNNINRSVGQQERPTSIKARRRTTLRIAGEFRQIFHLFYSIINDPGQMGVNWQPILAGAGVIGLAIGFGAQRL